MNEDKLTLIYPADLVDPQLKDVKGQAQNMQLAKKPVPLNGKLMLSSDASTIGFPNFQELTNMRYRDNHPYAISGMTKINSTIMDATYFKVRSSFHFVKARPKESHVLVQAWNTGLSTAHVLQNKTTIPNTGNFEATDLWSDTASAGIGSFSDAPDETVVYCNGIDTCIWGGDESSCRKFIIIDQNSNLTYDYTSQVQNTLQDSENVATMKVAGGGLDASVKALYHFENNALDSSTGGGHTLTIVNGAYATGVAGFFGTYCLNLPAAANATARIAWHADFDISGGIWTFDTAVQFDALTGAKHVIWAEITDGNKYLELCVNSLGKVWLSIYVGGVETLGTTGLESPNGAVIVGRKYHIEVAENGNYYYLFINGVLAATMSSIIRPALYTNSMSLGGYDDLGAGRHEFLVCHMDETRLSPTVCRHTVAFIPPTSAYSASSACTVNIAATRPINGAKFYVKTANASAATVACNYSDGTTMQACTTVADTTVVAGKTLATTGSVSFDTTVTLAHPQMINGNLAYWYQFIFTGIDATTVVYHTTLDAPMQAITDLWDGIDRPVLAFYAYVASKYTDLTLNVYTNSYDANDTSTYAKFTSLTTGTEFLIAGFSERAMGITVSFIAGKVNTTASTALTVYYSSDGSNWTTVGAISDGTASGGISFAQNGTITWNPPSRSLEFESKVSRLTPLYHYKLAFDKTLPADVEVFYIAGIPAPRTFGQYLFPIMAQDRLFLCNNQAEKKNSIIYSSVETNCVFNGDDTGEIQYEDADEIIGGVSLYSLFGSSLYNLILFFSRSAMFVLSGTIPNTDKHLVTSAVGLVAPNTLKTIALPEGVAPGINRNIAIWQGAEGVYISDGRSPLPIHHDINCFFDKKDSRRLMAAKVGDSCAFVDQELFEYHWLFYSGTGGTLMEYVFDLRRWKWFRINRTTGLELPSGLSVEDRYGNSYIYGFIDTGYMERLEYGTTFDSVDIVKTMHFGDFTDDQSIETRALKVNLIAVANTVSNASLTYTHYVDTNTTGTAIDMGTLQKTGYRTTNIVRSINSTVGVLHSAKFTITTNTEVCGFEPLALQYIGLPEREKLKET